MEAHYSLHDSTVGSPGCCPSVLRGRVDPRRRQPLPPEHSLPPRMLMIKLPLMMVQPRSSWADVTESMVFSPTRRWHTLGQGPRQGVHIKLQKEWGERSGRARTHTHIPTSLGMLRTTGNTRNYLLWGRRSSAGVIKVTHLLTLSESKGR